MKKFTTMLLVAMLLCGVSTKAFSWGGGHYHYGGGRYYSDSWFGFGAVMTTLAVGAYVASLPPQYDTVVVGGVPYYYADGYYYQTGPSGYVVVMPPASQGQTVPGGNNMMFNILGILFGILLLFGIGLLLKKLLVKEGKAA